MMKQLATGLTAACFLVAMVAVAISAPITYEAETNRPILMENIEADFGAGMQTYEVAVIWDSTFEIVYGPEYATNPELIAWGSVDDADVALDALNQELLADGFAGTQPAQVLSYLYVPYSGEQYILGRGINILNGGGNSIPYPNVTADKNVFYGTVGYTVWVEVEAVPGTLSSMGGVKALFR